MHNKYNITTYDFNLPEHLIAQHPLKQKGEARLLYIKDHICYSKVVDDLEALLTENDVLVFNNTKVIPSRLVGIQNDYQFNITLHYRLDASTWLAFVKNSKKLQVNQHIVINDSFKLKVVEKIHTTGEIKLFYDGDDLMDKLHQYGYMPLPPYIKRETINNADDYTDYQSIFATYEGAVAAPTASLHFSTELMHRIKAKGVEVVMLTLHVGAGTFMPVKVQDITQHNMHSEWGSIDKVAIKQLQNAMSKQKKIIAVGTTPLRVLEYVYSKYQQLCSFSGEIDLFIYPGFEFKVVDKLITNFHLPKSTLFMLVSAFCGLENAHRYYQYAIDNNYRFFSYGDCSFLERQ